MNKPTTETLPAPTSSVVVPESTFSWRFKCKKYFADATVETKLITIRSHRLLGTSYPQDATGSAPSRRVYTVQLVTLPHHAEVCRVQFSIILLQTCTPKRRQALNWSMTRITQKGTQEEKFAAHVSSNSLKTDVQQ